MPVQQPIITARDLTQSEVESFYSKKIDRSDPRPVSYGLNSKLVKEDGRISERVWKVGGMYSGAIEKIIYWLNKAVAVAENEKQKAALEKLVEYYETGDLKIFDEYNILWVQDTDSVVDLTNGFIEVYEDPLGYRGSYESLVSYRDFEASKRMTALSDNAQWFEDNAPFSDSFKKSEVTGVSGKVINVAGEAGDASPSTPIGINLPNANWIRKEHGSNQLISEILWALTLKLQKPGVSWKSLPIVKRKSPAAKNSALLGIICIPTCTRS